ncbi:MAG: Zn-dependent hydrolase [Bacteroidales bacterium]|nr:Zn-dependent hydrolase [Bacteroidales bacterium]
MRKILFFLAATVILLSACNMNKKMDEKSAAIQAKVDEFASFTLTSDISGLSDGDKQALPLLFEAAQIMDELFWEQAYGNRAELEAKISDTNMLKFVKINYGPWERLNANTSFIDGIGPKPAGATFYPVDMTAKEFDALEATDKTGLYTVIRRKSDGALESVPYHVAFKNQLEKVATLLEMAASLVSDNGFKNYLNLRAKALLNSEYLESDMAWMDMKTNAIDFVVGPIENYEDALYGYKAAFESFILVKDMEWSTKVDRYSSLLPQLQTTLPVEPKYKMEVPGASSDLGVYEVVYYAGDCNAGSKTIAINLPNDPAVHAAKGSRRLQLKNAMKAKFDKILVPISHLVIDESQRKNITFDAFFENVMFHEIAHGLGVNQTINGKGPVREALRDSYTSMEEGKADILGLFLIGQLHEMGEIKDKDLMDNYVTFMAGIFRSVRFGASSAHGKANMMRFNYFLEKEAFVKNEANGTYLVNFEIMKQCVSDLSNLIIVIQAEGDYDAASKLINEKGNVSPLLKADLERIANAGIPRDIVFKQGKEYLGL